jgi:hypothetical protein
MHNYLGIETGLWRCDNRPRPSTTGNRATACRTVEFGSLLVVARQAFGQFLARFILCFILILWTDQQYRAKRFGLIGAIYVLRHFKWRTRVPFTGLIAKPETTDAIRLQSRMVVQIRQTVPELPLRSRRVEVGLVVNP